MTASTSHAAQEDRAVARALSGVVAIALVVGSSLPWIERDQDLGGGTYNGWTLLTVLSDYQGEGFLDVLSVVLPTLAVSTTVVLLISMVTRPSHRRAIAAAWASAITAFGLVLLLFLAAGEGTLAGLTTCIIGALAGCGVTWSTVDLFRLWPLAATKQHSDR